MYRVVVHCAQNLAVLNVLSAVFAQHTPSATIF